MRALTGSRLEDGEAVFWKAGLWVERFADAELFDDAGAAEAAEALAKSQQTIVVDPYLIDVIPAGEGWAPLSYRERVRALGPTNHPQHGKQANGGADIAALVQASGASRSTGRLSLIRRK
jgi:sulfite reductase (NADPH) hemoprotein beta-component